MGEIAKSLGNVAAGMSALKGYQFVASSSPQTFKAVLQEFKTLIMLLKLPT